MAPKPTRLDPPNARYAHDKTGGKDSDGDGLSDLFETKILRTDPLKFDSDDDGVDDLAESYFGTDPRLRDSDGDRLSDREEIDREANPLSRDSDGDGVRDDLESHAGTLEATDTDKDGRPDWLDEALKDDDGDGLSNAEEARWLHTDPKKVDTDGDYLDDLTEVEYGAQNNRSPHQGEPMKRGLDPLQTAPPKAKPVRKPRKAEAETDTGERHAMADAEADPVTGLATAGSAGAAATTLAMADADAGTDPVTGLPVTSDAATTLASADTDLANPGGMGDEADVEAMAQDPAYGGEAPDGGDLPVDETFPTDWTADAEPGWEYGADSGTTAGEDAQLADVEAPAETGPSQSYADADVSSDDSYVTDCGWGSSDGASDDTYV